MSATYSTMLKIRGSISALFEHRTDDILHSPIIQRMFHAFFNISPPKPRKTFQWDPDDLLNILKTDKYNGNLTLQMLGKKTAMLILLASACRKYELLAIDINHLNFNNDGVQAHLVSMPKNFTTKHPDPTVCNITILYHPEDTHICPVEHIKQYLTMTKEIRTTTQMFITTTPPFGPLSKDRMGKWIKNLLTVMPLTCQPGANLQSPRSAASSALYKGVPLDTILAQCRWSNSSVFFHHYYKRNPNKPEVAFWKIAGVK